MAAASPQPAAPHTHIPATNANGLKLKETKRGKVYVGELPNSFLRLPTVPVQSQQLQHDSAFAQHLMFQQAQSVVTERINVTIVEAKLNKNYGMTKMDPYCRIKIGPSTYETPSCMNGAKTPQWNKVFLSPIDPEMADISIDVYDERAFTGDNRVAWCKLKIPDSVKEGKVLDDWWPLSGKLGDEKEGLIHLVMFCQKVQNPTMFPMQQLYNPMMVPQMPYYAPAGVPVAKPGAAPMAMMYPPQQPPQQQAAPPPITEEDIKQVKEMFPDTDNEVIKTVLEASRGNKDAAINSLLSMQ